MAYVGTTQPQSVTGRTVQEMVKTPQMRLVIESGNNAFEPPVKDEIKLERERVGAPAKLTFTTVKIGAGATTPMGFNEGDRVTLYWNNAPVFIGYVFTKKRDKEHHIEVTCYDQLRYLKNKFSYVFVNQTATQILKQLCTDFGLQTGTLEDTKYVIPVISEENAEAFDIILTALDETLANTGNMFVIYDKAGKIELKNCASLTCDTIIASDTAENFDYSTSIDEETYNSVVLYYNPNE